MTHVRMRARNSKGKIYDESARAADIFPVQAFIEEQGLFVCDDNHLGFVIECDPMCGVDDNTQKAMEGLFQNTPFPERTHVQVLSFRSPDIKDKLAEIFNLREKPPTDLLRRTIAERVKMLDTHTLEPLTRQTKKYRHNQGVIYDQKLYFSVKLPMAEAIPTQEEIRRAENMKGDVIAGLGTLNLNPYGLDAQQYIRMMNVLFNWGPDSGWRHGLVNYDDQNPISEQLLEYDNDIEWHEDGLRIGDYHVRTLSAKQFPRKTRFGAMFDFCGDLLYGTSSVKEHYLVCLNVYYPPQMAARSKFDRNRTFVLQQSENSIAKYIPILYRKRADFDALNEDITTGGFKFVKASLTVSIFCPNERRAKESASDFRSYLRKSRFDLMPNRLTHHANFFNSLPLFTDPTALDHMKRFKTMTPKQVAALVPAFGEWKGTGTPYMNLLSRNGQIMSYSKYDSVDNYNSLTCAASGSGKSFKTNNEIDSYMSEGARVWVIDVGRSYEKLCETHQGNFIEFSEQSKVCINPFPLVRDYKDEEDALVGIIRLMISHEHGISGVQLAGLKRTLAEVFAKNGNDTLIDHLEEALLVHEDPRVKDLGTQLFPFTSRGTYGRFFNGANSINFDKQFTVLELEELNGRQHLQQVVLAQILYQVQQVIYLDTANRDTKKLLYFDEAWAMLTNEGIAKVIETAYRRFRKYGGSIELITQSLLDLDKTELGQTLIANASTITLLGQKAENIKRSIERGYLDVPEGYERMLSTIKTVPGIFSEVFIKGSRGMGVGRLFVSDYQVLMYSTHPDDVAAIERYRRQGMSVSSAIDHVLVDRGAMPAESLQVRAQASEDLTTSQSSAVTEAV